MIEIACDGTNWQIVTLPQPVTMFVKEYLNGNSSTTLSTGAYADNALNTTEGVTGFGSLSSNAITLDPGNYIIKAHVPFYKNDVTHISYSVAAKIRDTTNSADKATSTPLRARNSGTTSGGIFTGVMYVIAEVTITSSTTYKIQTFVNDATSAHCGVASGTGADTYTTVEITRLR